MINQIIEKNGITGTKQAIEYIFFKNRYHMNRVNESGISNNVIDIVYNNVMEIFDHNPQLKYSFVSILLRNVND